MTDEQILPRKYRPTDFSTFVGNESMVESLKSVVRRKEGRPHCMLFQGPSGCGKTTLARICRAELGCSERNFREYDIGNMGGVDVAREIKGNARLAALGGGVKVYVLNECHRASRPFPVASSAPT